MSISSSSDFIGFLKNDLFTKKNAVIALKVMVVVAVIAGLAAAIFFTAGAAVAAGAALTCSSGIGKILVSQVLWGATVGLGISLVMTPVIAHACQMHKYIEGKNLTETRNFVLISFFLSAGLTGACALSGGAC